MIALLQTIAGHISDLFVALTIFSLCLTLWAGLSDNDDGAIFGSALSAGFAVAALAAGWLS